MTTMNGDTFNNATFKRNSNEKDLICMYWNNTLNTQMSLHAEHKAMFQGEIKRWRNLVKSKDIKFVVDEHVVESNSGRKFYPMTFQNYDDYDNINLHDPQAVLCFGYLIPGLTYFFPSKKIRDDVYNYVVNV
jgi:hypothetical protein